MTEDQKAQLIRHEFVKCGGRAFIATLAASIPDSWRERSEDWEESDAHAMVATALLRDGEGKPFAVPQGGTILDKEAEWILFSDCQPYDMATCILDLAHRTGRREGAAMLEELAKADSEAAAKISHLFFEIVKAGEARWEKEAPRRRAQLAACTAAHSLDTLR